MYHSIYTELVLRIDQMLHNKTQNIFPIVVENLSFLFSTFRSFIVLQKVMRKLTSLIPNYIFSFIYIYHPYFRVSNTVDALKVNGEGGNRKTHPSN